MTPTTATIESKIIMQGIHIELTEAMKRAILDRFSAVLHRNEHIIRIHVRLQMDQTMGKQHHFHATAQGEIGGPDLIASAGGVDAYRVIDELAQTLDRQVKERHGRAKEKRHQSDEVELDEALPKAE